MTDTMVKRLDELTGRVAAMEGRLGVVEGTLGVSFRPAPTPPKLAPAAAESYWAAQQERPADGVEEIPLDPPFVRAASPTGALPPPLPPIAARARPSIVANR